MEKEIFAAVDKLLPELWELALYMQKNPELSYEEFKAHKKIVTYLKNKGFECKESVGELNTAFIAKPKKVNSGPTVGFIAEYDALPEIGHACGHHLISTSAIGAAIVLDEILPKMKGNVAMIGTPAEESPLPPAKQTMIDNGAFENVDFSLMMHPGDRTAVGWNTLAINAVEFDFKGRATHAAMFPHEGRSALDAAIITMTSIEFLREHVRQDVRIHGIIKDGGTRANIVPENAKLQYHIRALDVNYLNEIEERFFNCARAGALATDTKLTINVLGRVANKQLSPIVDDLLLESAIKAGAVDVMEPEPEMGSTDYGNVTQIMPAGTLRAHFVPLKTPGHTREWAEAADKPPAKKCLQVSAKAMALTAYNLIMNKELLEKAKEDHKNEKMN